jgi:hypothetical protein
MRDVCPFRLLRGLTLTIVNFSPERTWRSLPSTRAAMFVFQPARCIRSHIRCRGIHGARRSVTRGASDAEGGQTPAPAKEASVTFDSTALPQNFCIIEDKATVQDFAKLQLQEIKEGIEVSVHSDTLRFSCFLFRCRCPTACPRALYNTPCRYLSLLPLVYCVGISDEQFTAPGCQQNFAHNSDASAILRWPRALTGPRMRAVSIPV